MIGIRICQSTVPAVVPGLRLGLGLAGVLSAPWGVALAQPPRPDHVVIVIEENHSFAQVIGSASAPYINELAQSGASFTSMYAITHPSQPNYLQFFSGSSQGVTNDVTPPAGAPFVTLNLAASLQAAGFTFVGYSEDLPGVGSLVSQSGSYYRKHNPWSNWQGAGVNQFPATVNQPFTAFPSDFSLLPAVSVVVPNQLHDMHDGTIAQADAWLVANIKPYADWAMANNSLLILTWDEDESASRNRIPTIFAGPMVKPGQRPETWTLHNLLHTVEAMYGAAHSGSSAQVRPIVGALAADPFISTQTFRQGFAGYAGAVDTFIEQAAPAAAHANDATIVVDGSPLTQGLVRFDHVIGNGAGLVPPGATVLSAKLSILTGPSSTNNDSSANVMSAHRMLVPWSGASTWDSLVGGVSRDGIEASVAAEFSLTPNVLNAWAVFDVTGTVQAWAWGGANLGWLLNPSGTDGWRWVSSESSVILDRPVLEVTYVRCGSDFDEDGFVTGDDFDAYVSAFEAGSVSADFTGDGFLTGEDFDGFVSAFIGGC